MLSLYFRICPRSPIDLALTIYAIVFYAGFSPALEVQKSVMFFTLYYLSHKSQEKYNQIYLSLVF